MSYYTIDPAVTKMAEQAYEMEGNSLSIALATPGSDFVRSRIIPLIGRGMRGKDYDYEQKAFEVGGKTRGLRVGLNFDSSIIKIETIAVEAIQIMDSLDIEEVKKRLLSRPLFREWTESESILSNIEKFMGLIPHACNITKDYRRLTLGYRISDQRSIHKFTELMSRLANIALTKFSLEKGIPAFLVSGGKLYFEAEEFPFSNPLRNPVAAINVENVCHYIEKGEPLISEKSLQESYLTF